MITAKTTTCCVIGNPIEHSLSPQIHNAAYEHMGLPYVYVACKVSDIEHAVKGIKALHIKGVSVTIPHKEMVMKYLDVIADEARQIGAVNTIVNSDGKLTGYNTDGQGAIQALEEKTTISNKKVVLLGAGGAAKAIAYAIRKKGGDLLILNRSEEKAKKLADATGTRYGGLTMLDEVKTSDILIHATPSGMTPHREESLVHEALLHKNLTVFDIVYNPKETKLLRDAQKAGCKVVYGYKMLVYQAVTQFELFTGEKAPVAIMEKTLLKGLKGA